MIRSDAMSGGVERVGSSRRRRALWRDGLLAVTLLCMGCGSPLGADVSGVVTLDGIPLRLGTVMFHPVADGVAAYGAIQPDGSYSLQTGRESGLPAGDYVVTVVANEPPAVASMDGGPPPPGKPISPDKYRDKASSDLRVTVARGNNQIPIELTSAG